MIKIATGKVTLTMTILNKIIIKETVMIKELYIKIIILGKVIKKIMDQNRLCLINRSCIEITLRDAKKREINKAVMINIFDTS